MEVLHETTPNHYCKHGKTLVGTNAVPISVETYTLHRGILIRLHPLASSPVYIGNESVSADEASEAVGFRVDPGAVLHLPLEDPSQVYAIADDTDLLLFWIGA